MRFGDAEPAQEPVEVLRQLLETVGAGRGAGLAVPPRVIAQDPVAPGERPGLPVIALSPVLATARKLAAVWGMHCVLTSDPENQAAMVRKACRIAFDEGFAKAGDGVIIVAGVPLGSPGTTNMVRIAHLDDAGNPVAEGT